MKASKKEITNLKSQNTKSKNEKEKLKEANKALEMQLKELNTQLQSQLSNREQHAQREALVRELKEELKAKTLTVETMQTKFAELEEKLLKEKGHLESVIEVKNIDILELKNAQTTLKDELKEVNSQCEVLNFDKKELEEKLKVANSQKDKFLENLQEIGKEVAKEVPIKEIKEIPEAVKTVLNQNKSLQEQKTVLNDKLVELEKKINSSSNMSHPQPPISIQKEFELIKKEEIEEKEVKTGLFQTEKAKVLKSETNFLQRTWNLISKKYEDLKEKYNDLVFKYNQVANENKTLKAELEELKERSSTKQQKNKITTPEMLVKRMEASTGIEEAKASTIQNEKKLTGLEKFKQHQEKMREQIKAVQEQVREEKSNSKKRSFGRER